MTTASSAVSPFADATAPAAARARCSRAPSIPGNLAHAIADAAYPDQVGPGERGKAVGTDQVSREVRPPSGSRAKPRWHVAVSRETLVRAGSRLIARRYVKLGRGPPQMVSP